MACNPLFDCEALYMHISLYTTYSDVMFPTVVKVLNKRESLHNNLTMDSKVGSLTGQSAVTFFPGNFVCKKRPYEVMHFWNFIY